MKRTIFTIPNMLSIVRLCLIPFITATYSRGWELAAIILLVISGFTDLLDGFIARHFNQISDFGKILDPMADKLTTAAVVFSLVLRHPQVGVVLAVLVVKELMMLVGSYILIKKGTRPAEAKLFGKLSTAFLYLILFLVMLSDVIEEFTGRVFLSSLSLWILSGVSCVIMLCALIQYSCLYRAITNGTYNVETERFEGEISK